MYLTDLVCIVTVHAFASNVDAVEAEEVADIVVLDVGPTSLLSSEVSRARINVRPRNQRAPTTAARRLQEQLDSQLNDSNTTDTSTSAVDLAEMVSC